MSVIAPKFKLSEFIKSGDSRDLSATVSAQNEVIKDSIKQIENLKTKIEELEIKIDSLI